MFDLFRYALLEPGKPFTNDSNSFWVGLAYTSGSNKICANSARFCGNEREQISLIEQALDCPLPPVGARIVAPFADHQTIGATRTGG